MSTELSFLRQKVKARLPHREFTWGRQLTARLGDGFWALGADPRVCTSVFSPANGAEKTGSPHGAGHCRERRWRTMELFLSGYLSPEGEPVPRGKR